jgi:hypothetical protein
VSPVDTVAALSLKKSPSVLWKEGLCFPVVLLKGYRLNFNPRRWKSKEILKLYTGPDHSRSPQRHAKLVSHLTSLTGDTQPGLESRLGEVWGMDGAQGAISRGRYTVFHMDQHRKLSPGFLAAQGTFVGLNPWWPWLALRFHRPCCPAHPTPDGAILSSKGPWAQLMFPFAPATEVGLCCVCPYFKRLFILDFSWVCAL